MINVVVPVKSLVNAKSRLSSVLEPSERAGLVLAMLHDLLRTLRQRSVDDIWLVASDSAVFDMAREFGVRKLCETRTSGYNRAVTVGLQAVNQECPAIVLPADIPIANALDLARLTARPRVSHSVIRIVPDQWQIGTNGLYLSRPSLILPVFGTDSYTAHKTAAKRAEVHTETLSLSSLAADIDTPGDLAAFAQSNQDGTTARYLSSIGYSTNLWHGKERVRA